VLGGGGGGKDLIPTQSCFLVMKGEGVSTSQEHTGDKLGMRLIREG
jgi:hypothetical protein